MAKFQRQINFIQCLGYITACLVGSAFAAEQEKLDNGTGVCQESCPLF
jgi:hypothetical protein